MFSRYLTLALEWARHGFDIGFLLIGILGGLYFFWRKVREEHFDLLASFDSIIFAAIAGALGARAGYVFLHLNEFKDSILSIIQFRSYPGLWAVSGFIAAFYVMYRGANEQKQDSWEMWDFFSLLLSWFFAFYWLSRFAIGAAAGTSTTLPWGVMFPQRVEAAHPVQLYAAFGYFLLFGYLLWAEPRYRFFFWYRSKKRTAKTGFLFSMFMIFSGLIGFLLSFVQYPFFLLFDLDVNQVVQALIFVAGCVLLFVRSGRSFFLTRETKSVRSTS